MPQEALQDPKGHPKGNLGLVYSTWSVPEPVWQPGGIGGSEAVDRTCLRTSWNCGSPAARICRHKTVRRAWREMPKPFA